MTPPASGSRIAGDRPVPHIVTELPGPKARAHVQFDETWTSPSLPRAYPIVPIRGDGLTVEDIDGNLFLDFAAGIAVNSTGLLLSVAVTCRLAISCSSGLFRAQLRQRASPARPPP